MTDFERELRDRLHATSLPTAPVTLHETLREVVAQPVPIRRDRRPWALLAVAAVLAGTGAVLLSGATDPPVTDPSLPPAPSTEVAIATLEPTPWHASFPAEVEGMRVYSVSELLDERAAGRIDGEPVAVSGYWSGWFGMHSCVPQDPRPGELEIACAKDEFGIAERNEQVMVQLDPSGRMAVAEGPVLQPFLPNEEWIVPLISLQPINGQVHPPVPIVITGHFDDPRAKDCRKEERRACRDRLVLDRIVEFDPGAVPTPAITPTPSPFPFDSPPPLSIDVKQCADSVGTDDFSYVGWMDADELRALFGDDGPGVQGTVAVAITRDPVRLAKRQDKDGRQYQLMGRNVCFAQEWDTGVMVFSAVEGSLYRLYADGTIVPTDGSR